MLKNEAKVHGAAPKECQNGKRERAMEKELVGAGLKFDVDVLDFYIPILGAKKVKALRQRCQDKPLFGVRRSEVHDPTNTSCTRFIIDRFCCICEETLDKLIAGKIPMNGQPLTRVLPDAYLACRKEGVMRYKEKDFVTDDGAVVDVELAQSCKGLPVFSPPNDNNMSRDWARHTARVLASNKILRSQILANKLRFLGQKLSSVLQGAAAKDIVFREGDFELSGVCNTELKEIMIGRPMFLPDEGCEFVLANSSGYGWGGHQIYIFVKILPYLADLIISGELPLDGRRLTEIQFYPLPVYNPCPVDDKHLFKSRDKWLESYSKVWIGIEDFPQRVKPDWAASVTDADYFRYLREMAAFPIVAGAYDVEDADRVAVRFNKHRAAGFYNEKHRELYHALFNLDYSW